MPHDPLAVARSYVEKHGARLGLPAWTDAPSDLKIDPAKSTSAGALYEKLKHNPQHPKIRAAYQQFQKEILDQYNHLLAAGVHVEPWRGEGPDYMTADHVRADLKHNNHLYYYPTQTGFGTTEAADHPLKEVAPNGIMYNDMFRPVHDYYGHAKFDHNFDAEGEQRAWHEHAKMFSPLARLAMTAETHGQNSWLHFAPSHAHKPLADRTYAEQKATLMPITQHPVKLALVNAAKFKFHPQDEAGRGALADHMAEEGDAREPLLRADPDALPPTGYTFQRYHERFDQFVPRTVGQGNRNSYVKKSHVFPDGTELRVTNFHDSSGERPDLARAELHTQIEGDKTGVMHHKYMTHPEFDQWVDTFPPEEAHKIKTRFMDPKGPRPKMKLARAPGLMGRLKHIFTGAKPEGRTEYDGIVHRGFKNGRLDPDGYAKVVAEKSAVATALQRMGSQTARTDPVKHREKVNLFTEIAHSLHVADHPGLKPILDHYRKAAEQLNAPDVVSPQPDPPKMGEFPEPPNHTRHFTVPNIGPAGMDLADAATPLVRAIDRILARVKPGHVALDDAKSPDPVTKADEKEATKPTNREVPEVVPTIKPPKNDGFAIGLADMRKFKKELRTEDAARPNEMDADLEAKEELPPLPLVNYPGEIGPTGDRYFDINKLLTSGSKRTDVVRHLMDKYALTPRNAAATLNRFLKHKSNIGRSFKLARARAVARKDFTTAADSQIGGSRFAYHLAQIANEWKDTLLGKAAKYALGLKGKDRLHPAADSRLAGLDVYARIGKLLNERAMPVADETHRKMEAEVRKYQPTGTVHEAFDKLTPEQRQAVAAHSPTATLPDAALVDFRDRAVARHFRDAYNWHKVDAGLALDRHVENFLKKHIKDAATMGADDLHTAAHRAYDLDRGAALGRNKDAHAQFWDRIKKHVRENHGQAVPVAKINESLARLADRAYERQEIGAVQPKDRPVKPKPAPASAGGGTIHGWRDSFGWLPGARHAKFQRPPEKKGWVTNGTR